MIIIAAFRVGQVDMMASNPESTSREEKKLEEEIRPTDKMSGTEYLYWPGLARAIAPRLLSAQYSRRRGGGERNANTESTESTKEKPLGQVKKTG